MSFAGCFRKIGFDENFTDWIKIFFKNQESCVIKRGSTTPYFNFEKDVRQHSSISAYSFIIALEIILAITKSNLNI